MKKSQMHVIQRAHEYCDITREWKKAPVEQRDVIGDRLSAAKRKLFLSCDYDAGRMQRAES